MKPHLVLSLLVLVACNPKDLGDSPSDVESWIDSFTGETADTKGVESPPTDTDGPDEPVTEVYSLTCEGEESYYLDLDLGLVPGAWPPGIVVWAKYSDLYRDLTWEVDENIIHLAPAGSWRVLGTYAVSDDGHIKLPCRWITPDSRTQYWGFESTDYRVLVRR